MAIRYHYCNKDTFNKIISNKTLRFSDIRQSNDRDEMIMLLKKFEGIGSLSDYFNHEDHDYYKESEEFLKWITEEMACFASCLSVGSDKLSQWERYGDKCKGFAIGFNEEKLQSYVNKIDNILEEYDPKMKKENIIDLDGNLNFAKIIAKKVTYEKLRDSVDVVELNQMLFDMKYLESCAFTKHIGFREEKEFRIALIVGKQRGKQKLDFLEKELDAYVDNYVINRPNIIDYIDFKFPIDIIDEIYIGPLNDMSEKQLEKKLDKFNVSCKIIKSKIPYSPKRNLKKRKVKN